MAYLSLFFACFLSATIIPFSSEVILGGMLTGDFNRMLLLLVASIGNTIGGIVSYYMGYFAKWHWIEKYLRVKQENLLNTQHKVNQYGIWIALFTWLPLVGDGIALAMGVLKTHRSLTFLFMALGKTLRYAAIIYLAQFF